jgi:hypothetical protein
MYQTLEKCPEFELVKCIHKGNWTHAIAEVFMDTDNGVTVPTHLHFYVTREKARKEWSGIKHLIPTTIQTVSFKH